MSAPHTRNLPYTSFSSSIGTTSGNSTIKSKESVKKAPKLRPKSVDVHMGGFLLHKSMVRQLCIDAFNFNPDMVDTEGPLNMADLYFNQFTSLDSPSLVPIMYRSRSSPTGRRQGYLVVCRLAYVYHGKATPDLPFDAKTEEYIERWFPRRIRESPAFKYIRYVQCPLPDDVPGRVLYEWTYLRRVLIRVCS